MKKTIPILFLLGLIMFGCRLYKNPNCPTYSKNTQSQKIKN